jgi:hypothetical protein
MSYKPTAFINFILLSCTANWTTSSFTKRYQLSIFSVKATNSQYYRNSFFARHQNVAAEQNVVLITIESYSAEFMKMYGNQNAITPF